MYHFKLVFVIAVAVQMAATGCKAPRYLQQYGDIVDSSFMKQIAINLSGEDSIIDARMFSARISEKMVERNTVGEYSLVNDLSEKKTIDLQDKPGYNELYFYELSSINEQRYGIFLAATFAAEGRDTACVGLGPLYIGFISKGGNDSNRFVIEKEYALKKEKGTGKIILSEQKAAPALYWMYTYVQGNKTNVLQLRFSEIIQQGKNKISGTNKPLVYNIQAIFNDPDALRFSLVTDHK